MTDENFEDDFEGKSKSAIKREFLALQDLARDLVKLPVKHLDEIPLNDTLREGVDLARGLKQGALARQIKYLGGLLAHEEIEPINIAFAKLRLAHKKQTDNFHELEDWRDRLIAGDMDLLNELMQKYARLDRQHIHQLMRNAVKEQQANKPPKSSRALFRYLSESISQDN